MTWIILFSALGHKQKDWYSVATYMILTDIYGMD